MLQFLLKKIHNRKGFTLIELVVVITILGVLALIAVPRFGGFTKTADEAATKATERTIKSAITMLEAQEGKNFADMADDTKYDALEEFLDGVTIKEGTAADTTDWVVTDDGTVYAPTPES